MTRNMPIRSFWSVRCFRSDVACLGRCWSEYFWQENEGTGMIEIAGVGKKFVLHN